MSPWEWRVEVAQRQAGELGLDVLAHAVDGPLCDAGHHVALRPVQHGPGHVDERRQAKSLPRCPKSTPTPGVSDMPRTMSASWPCPLDRKRAIACCFGHPGREALADDAVEEHVGRAPEYLRPEHGEGDARGCHRDHEHERAFSGESPRKAPHGVAEVLRLSAGMDIPMRPPKPPPPRPGPAGAGVLTQPPRPVARRRSLGTRDRTMRSSSCGPIPTMRPSSRTMILSA